MTRWGRARKKDETSWDETTTGNIDFGHTSPEEIFMEPRLRPPGSRRERVEFLDSATLDS